MGIESQKHSKSTESNPQASHEIVEPNRTPTEDVESADVEKVLAENKEKIKSAADDWLKKEERRSKERIESFAKLGSVAAATLFLGAVGAELLFGDYDLKFVSIACWTAIFTWLGGHIGETVGKIIENKKTENK